ncbi:uncharacterized protein LOC133931422 [Phragmites australis]|uniref:uncharacterized protein LOC133931422 n=1 Tax=Phragmites australis TaxID=29695 RepID=UPI002D79563B|nr:uncharacterized protein LOC133931422 [Phragmites australis]
MMIWNSIPAIYLSSYHTLFPVAKHQLSDSADQLSDVGDGDVNQECDPGNMDDMYGGVTVNSEIDSLPDPKDQVTWLKLELCRLLEERRSAVLRFIYSFLDTPSLHITILMIMATHRRDIIRDMLEIHIPVITREPSGA